MIYFISHPKPLKQNNMNLQNKTIVIVGGATGIGRATAFLCRDLGATVIIADISQPVDWDSLFFPVDVTDEGKVRSLFNQIMNQFGHIDALVQTAGILKGQFTSLDELDVATFRQVIDINVTGSFLCAKYAAPLLRKGRKPVIILLSSGAATGGSSSLAYGSSKGGVNGLFVTLANRLAAENIRVNVVSPGNIDTPMKRSVIQVDADRRGVDLQSAMEESHLGSPDGVAKVIAFLVGDDADYVRGIVTTR